MEIKYGIIINGQLVRLKTKTEESKPIMKTIIQFEEGYRYTYHWEELEDSIVQAWQKLENN